MRKERCVVDKPRYKNDLNFITELSEEKDLFIEFEQVDFIGWTINGKTKPIGISYTISRDGEYAYIGIEYNDEFMEKLYKQLKKKDVYTFVEDFIYRVVEKYQERGINNIEIHIPPKSKTIKTLLAKNGFKKSKLLMEFNGGK